MTLLKGIAFEPYELCPDVPKLFNSLPRVLYPNQDPLLHLFIEAAATVFIQRPPVEVTAATVVGQIVRDSFMLGFQKPVSRIL